ncbi:hypothetical protein RQP46_001621 [Phenoliferia psychrophenolica]
MSSSLSPACNASKTSYDTCFNHWFKSYLLLVSPPHSAPSTTSVGAQERDERTRAIAEKKDEYERECGGRYREYQECLKGAIKGKDGLAELLESARKEEPLTGWGAIKVVSEADLREE